MKDDSYSNSFKDYFPFGIVAQKESVIKQSDIEAPKKKMAINIRAKNLIKSISNNDICNQKAAKLAISNLPSKSINTKNYRQSSIISNNSTGPSLNPKSSKSIRSSSIQDCNNYKQL
jgi:hypothetical protein